MENKGVFLSNRQISILLSTFILSIFFVFISGYFFGKKKAVDKFYNKIDKESLADQVYYSVCSTYGCDDIDQKQESTEDGSGQEDDERETLEESGQSLENENFDQEATAGALEQKQDRLAPNNALQAELRKNVESNVLSNKNTDISTDDSRMNDFQEKQTEEYYAELIGFGTKSAAQAFCSRLKKDGINVILKKRTSKSPRGRLMYWYQAVTEKFDNKRDLIAVIDIIKDKENLKGVKIIQV